MNFRVVHHSELKWILVILIHKAITLLNVFELQFSKPLLLVVPIHIPIELSLGCAHSIQIHTFSIGDDFSVLEFAKP